MLLPSHGRPANDILNDLAAFKANDLPWQDGKVFAYVYDPGIEGRDLLKQAYGMYLTENALDPTVFPSTLKLENDIISIAASLVGGGKDTVGNFTTGGTESIILSVKTARDYYRHIRPEITQPEIILPHTAHAAFHKACHYLGVKAVIVPVDTTTFQAIPEEMEKAITPNSILMVGSAPGYAHGVIDPIPEMAAIAHKHGLLFHTDACVGGLFLPFAKKLGHDVPPFDLSVPGVTSLSMDFHKFGYAAKGASAVLYNSRELRRFQIYACSGWAGYTIINTTVLSSKGGGSLAACWAILNLFGEDGYKKVVQDCIAATNKIIRWTEEQDTGLYVLGKPDANLIAISSHRHSVFRICDRMRKLGWYLQPQLGSPTSPENIHFSIGKANLPHIDAMLNDLSKCLRELDSEPETSGEGMPDTHSLAAMLETASPEQVGQLLAMLGIQGGSLPGDLEPINQILNKLPVSLRDRLLVDYFNQLFNS